MILAGDVGGTKTVLALLDADLRLVRERRHPSQEHASLTDVVRAFLEDTDGPVEAACFGVAGPVRAGRARITNLPWIVDARELGASLGIPRVRLVNDLIATAMGIAALGPDQLVVLQAGEPDPEGGGAVVAPGTGLGVAGLAWTGAGRIAVPSEGGHCDLAPRDDREVELLRWLQRRHGHASWEHVLSGPGLRELYEFLRDTGRGTESAEMAQRLAGIEDPAPCISEAALDGSSELAREAVTLFLSLLGAKAGNVALELLATNGIWIGGGIVPHLASMLPGPFLPAFRARGKMSRLAERIPVAVILEDRTALLGAARCALDLA